MARSRALPTIRGPLAPEIGQGRANGRSCARARASRPLSAWHGWRLGSPENREGRPASISHTLSRIVPGGDERHGADDDSGSGSPHGGGDPRLTEANTRGRASSGRSGRRGWCSSGSRLAVASAILVARCLCDRFVVRPACGWSPIRSSRSCWVRCRAPYLVFQAFRLHRPARAAALARSKRQPAHRTGRRRFHRPSGGRRQRPGERRRCGRRTGHALLASLEPLKAGMPSPGLARRDPMAVPLPSRCSSSSLPSMTRSGNGPGELGGRRRPRGSPTHRRGSMPGSRCWPIPARLRFFSPAKRRSRPGNPFPGPGRSVVHRARPAEPRHLDVVQVPTLKRLRRRSRAVKLPPAKAGDEPRLERQVKPGDPGLDPQGDRAVMSWQFAVEPDHAPKISFAPSPPRRRRAVRSASPMLPFPMTMALFSLGEMLSDS